MLHEKLLAHFQNPRNVGELPEPAVTAEVSNPVCGDILRLWVRMENGRAAEVRYRVRGCTASIAAGSALTGCIAGRTVAEIGNITAAAIEAELGELQTASKHAAALCVAGARAVAGKLA